MVARADPDGYTIILATITLATNPSLYKSLDFDATKDLAPITLIAGVPHMLVVNPALPVQSVRATHCAGKAKAREIELCLGGRREPVPNRRRTFQAVRRS